MHKVLYKHIEVKAKASFMQIQHVRRLSFMINDLEEGQVEKEENIMKNFSEYFGNLVFDDRVMKATLSAEVYQSLKKTIDGGERLDIDVYKRQGVYNGKRNALQCQSGYPEGSCLCI